MSVSYRHCFVVFRRMCNGACIYNGNRKSTCSRVRLLACDLSLYCFLLHASYCLLDLHYLRRAHMHTESETRPTAYHSSEQNSVRAGVSSLGESWLCGRCPG